MNKSHVAAAIKSIRLYRGMTQEELARKLFVTRQTVSNYETGRSNPDIETLKRISEILEVDVNDIIYGNGELLTSVISKRRMIMSAVIFCAYVILTLTLFLLTNELKNRGGPFAPYILVRVLLIPIGGIHIRTKKAGAQMAKTGQNNMHIHRIAEHYILYAVCSLDSVFMPENVAWRPHTGAIPRCAGLSGDIAVFPESDVQLSVRLHISRNSLWGGFFKRGLYYDAPEGKIIMSKRFLAI